ncbi:hypothetical protein DENSPDRAFT_196878 [Dentipellis sp. KUC8613]|nr:hypothetical protein DENSPDRAFT_196878 [Dentipellis sp. KUC8613]
MSKRLTRLPKRWRCGRSLGAQLNNTFALSWTFRQELACIETRLSSVLEKKKADNEWRRQENERREVEARQREEHRHRCEEEAKRKEEDLHARHQTQIETKRWLDHATGEVDRLKEALKKEAEHCSELESKLASTRAQTLSLQKAERIKKSDDKERRVLDHKREDEAKQHEQDRVRRKGEVAKKEAELCFSHRLQLKATQKELDDAMRKIDQLETNLQEETDQGVKLLEDCTSYELQLKAIEEKLRAAEEKQNAAKEQLVTAEKQREVAVRLQQGARAGHQHMRKEMLSAQFHCVIAVAEFDEFPYNTPYIQWYHPITVCAQHLRSTWNQITIRVVYLHLLSSPKHQLFFRNVARRHVARHLPIQMRY